MRLATALCALLLTSPALAQQIVPTAPHPAYKRPNDPSVPDAYALSGQFERIVVMRMKFQTELLAGMQDLAKKKPSRMA